MTVIRVGMPGGVNMRIMHSGLATKGLLTSNEEFNDWFSTCETHANMVVERIPFEDMEGWSFTAGNEALAHASGRFFSIDGVRVVKSGRGTQEWAQPIINQPEVGIIGYLAKEFDGILHFLVQAKVEPGNRQQLQLSPTVQATRSNYTKVHGGASTPYLEYFLQPGQDGVIADILQSEQGSWFLRKRNRNMIVETADDVPVRENFRWLTLGQLRELLALPNMVNMDSRSVLSCLPFPATGWQEGTIQDPGTELAADLRRSIFTIDAGCCTTNSEISGWLDGVRARTHISVEPVSLAALPDWEVSPADIAHHHGKYFRIIATSVQTGVREVSTWCQPLLAPCGIGVIAFLSRRIDGLLHVLARASAEPGLPGVVEIGPTVQCDPANYADLPSDLRPPFLDYVLEATDNVRYDVLHSEEGGRFYHAECRYMLVATDDDPFPFPFPEAHSDFRWMTIGQLLAMHEHLNVETRSLIACLHSLW